MAFITYKTYYDISITQIDLLNCMNTLVTHEWRIIFFDT